MDNMKRTQTELFYEPEWAEAGQLAICICFFLLHVVFIVIVEYKKDVTFTKISMQPFWLSMTSAGITMIFYITIIQYNFEDYYKFELWESTFARIIYTFYHANVCFIDLNWNLLTNMLIF